MSFKDFLEVAGKSPDYFGKNVSLLADPLQSAIEILNAAESAADKHAQGLAKEDRFSPDYISKVRTTKIAEDREAYQSEVLIPLSELFTKASEQFENGLSTAFYPKSNGSMESDRTVGAIEKQRADNVYSSELTADQTKEMIKRAVKAGEVDFASRLVERTRIDFYKSPEAERQAKAPQHNDQIRELNSLVVESLSGESKEAFEKLQESAEKFRAFNIEFKALKNSFEGGSNFYVTEEMIKSFDPEETKGDSLKRFHSAASKSKLARAEAEATL